LKECEGVVVLTKPELKDTINDAIRFINDNVFPSFTRWRMESEEVKFKVLINCLKLYNTVFSVKDEKDTWDELKKYCGKSLLKSTTSLMSVLGIGESELLYYYCP
jgi:hypothetical protein